MAGFAGVVILACAMSISSILFFRLVTVTDQQNTIAVSLIASLVAQRTFANDYIVYHEERPQAQWRISSQRISDTIAHYPLLSPDETVLIERLEKSRREADTAFLALKNIYEQPQLLRNAAQETQLISQLSLVLQEMTEGALELLTKSKEHYNQAHGQYHLVLTISLVLLFAYIVIILLFIKRRVIGPLAALKRGTALIAGGNFNHRIAIRQNDEIGALAHSFNEMVHALEQTYRNLEEKIADLNRLTKTMVGRELRMIKLKELLKRHKSTKSK